MNTVYIIRTREYDVDNYPTWTPRPEYGYFETQSAANAWCEAQPNPKYWDYEEVELTRPLDPQPWAKGRATNVRKEERAVTPPEGEYPGKGMEKWRFEPRRGFEVDSALYAQRGGLDPLPLLVPVPEGLVLRGRTRYGMGESYFGRIPLVFDPREGFETNLSKYGA